MLATCLDAVVRQQDVSVEIVVLDSGSTDATLDIARRFPVVIRTMPPADFTYGYALNLGFGACSHGYLVALSGHSIPCHDRWLAHLLRHFEDPAVAAVSGPEVNRWAPAPPAGAIVLTRDTFFRDPRFGFSNFNAAIRRGAWERVPFHESLRYGEDKEWAWRLVRDGARIVIDPEASVYHEHREPLRDMWRRGRNEALGQAAWRGAKRYSLGTALRLAVVRALGNVGRGRWDTRSTAGAFAYFLGRYAGFAESRACPLPPGPRQLTGRRRTFRLGREAAE
jgi:glycosyltransferase involved in cell wall biosynthesis